MYTMKKIGLFCFILCLSIEYAVTQDDDERGGHAVKRIEYNMDGSFHALYGKIGAEKRLLDKINAPVEFFFCTLYEVPTNPEAFRIMRDSSNSFYILNYNRYKDIKKDNDIVSRTFVISDQFANLMYKKMVSLIDNFNAQGKFRDSWVHGFSVTFRVVVEDAVWALQIHMPSGKAEKMSNLCRLILKNAEDNKLDEAKYIKILDEFDF